jgi:hypothetical protein
MEISSEEEKKMGTFLSSNEIMKVCKMWETVQKFVEKHHCGCGSANDGSV